MSRGARSDKFLKEKANEDEDKPGEGQGCACPPRLPRARACFGIFCPACTHARGMI